MTLAVTGAGFTFMRKDCRANASVGVYRLRGYLSLINAFGGSEEACYDHLIAHISDSLKVLRIVGSDIKTELRDSVNMLTMIRSGALRALALEHELVVVISASAPLSYDSLPCRAARRVPLLPCPSVEDNRD
jgi:hypothetical protein